PGHVHHDRGPGERGAGGPRPHGVVDDEPARRPQPARPGDEQQRRGGHRDPRPDPSSTPARRASQPSTRVPAAYARPCAAAPEASSRSVSSASDENVVKPPSTPVPTASRTRWTAGVSGPRAASASSSHPSTNAP